MEWEEEGGRGIQSQSMATILSVQPSGGTQLSITWGADVEARDGEEGMVVVGLMFWGWKADEVADEDMMVQAQ